jgi:hypothetical protein
LTQHCSVQTIEYNVVPGVAWGLLPTAWQAAFNSATMNCPTILAQGFKLQHRSGLFALGIDAGDVIEGSDAARVTLSTTAPLYKQATAATASYVRLITVSTSRYIRFSGEFVYIMGLSATVTNFDWKAVEAPGMGFYYQNTAGNRIGYDSVANRLTIVGPTSTLLVIYCV